MAKEIKVKVTNYGNYGIVEDNSLIYGVQNNEYTNISLTDLIVNNNLGNGNIITFSDGKIVIHAHRTDLKQYECYLYNVSGKFLNTIYIDDKTKTGEPKTYVMVANGVAYLRGFTKTWYSGSTHTWNSSYLASGTSTDILLATGTTVLVGEDLGDKSTTGGQNGTLDDTTDIIPVPDIPTVSLLNCGMVSAYKMTVEQLRLLSGELWSANSELLENLKKMFLDNPLESIMSLSLIPLNLSGTTGNIKIGNYPTQIGATILSEQYITLDCGSINVGLYWGNSLDYDPYTKFDLYLPMVGSTTLSADEIVGKTLAVKYTIDIVNGSCIAFVLVNNSVLYTASGNCALQLPISGRDASNLYSSALKATLAAIPSITFGGAVGAISTVSSGINVLNSKPSVQHSGNMSGNSGVLNVKYPVLTITRARQSLPEKFYKYKGYTSNITEQIKNLSGYTEIEYIRLENIEGITDTELNELETILKGGFIVK